MCLPLRKCLQWTVSHWRLKVKVMFVTFLLVIIIYQHHQIKRARQANIAIGLEKRSAAETIAEVVTGLQQGNSSHGVELAGHILRLDTAALLLGGGAGQVGGESGEVCPEKYTGNTDWPYQYNSWKLEDCNYGQDLRQLVSLVVRADTREQVERVSQSLWSHYPGLPLVVRTSVQVKLPGLLSVGEDVSLAEVAGLVSTKYVVLADDLDYVSNWTNLARAVRLVSAGGLSHTLSHTLLAVGGAVRNSSGHWRLECSQLHLHYYRLELRPGYELQYQDCMVCSHVGGPLLLRTESLKQTSADIPPHLAVMDLVIQGLGLVLACPDIMFFTSQSTGQEVATTTRDQWKKMAAKHQFQAVVTNFRKELAVEFECEEVNLYCDIRSQAAAFILPWCCYKSFRHILTSLEVISTKLGIDYQLESGSCLGAVKLANFIPWDIDIDIEFATKDYHHFKSGGQAYSYLTEAGIKLYSFKKDMYAVKDAGMFNMEYGGITVEMMGSLRPLSRQMLPGHLSHSPTRIEISPGLWSPVLSHPGLYSRGRYGPGYLYHVQSWRHVAGMSSSYHSYSPGAWQPCTQPGHQACLNNYPILGNTELLSQIYP